MPILWLNEKDEQEPLNIPHEDHLPSPDEIEEDDDLDDDAEDEEEEKDDE